MSHLVVETYSNARHYEMVCRWLAHRGMPNPDKRLFSPTGFVVDETAVGFVMLTNSRQMYIDHIAADPTKTPKQRDVALCFLIKALEDIARSHGAILVTVLANLPAMKKRFEKLGYLKHGDYTLYFKQLGLGG